VDIIKRQIGNAMPSELTWRIKGDRCSTSGVAVGTITDNDSGEVTLLNSATKQFATVSFADYEADIARAVPEQQIPEVARQMLQSLKLNVQLKKTGQTRVIGGIRAEESLMTLSMDIPAPAAGAMKIETHNWIAADQEATRIPALKELAACSRLATSSNNLAQAIQKSSRNCLAWRISFVTFSRKSAKVTLAYRWNP
jgi:hypothetical protein